MIDAHLRLQRGDFLLDAQFSIPASGISALYGPSGAGKTSLLRAIAGLEAASGELQIGGEYWQNEHVCKPVHERAVGYVFQEASLFDHLRVRGNLEYGARRNGQSTVITLNRAVELLNLDALLHKYPAELSGGERKRVAIGRALLRNPQLMLLDEPLASLDVQHQRELLPFLETLHAATGIPMIFVSHSPDEVARLADHLLLMDNGRIVATGPLPELLTRLDLQVSHQPDAAAIIETQPIGYDPEFDLSTLAFNGGELQVAGNITAAKVRVRILARDVSLALSEQRDTSILNILPATVTAVDEDMPGQALLKLDAGGTPLLSRITRRSVQNLSIKPGLAVYAQIKSVALLSP